MKEKQAPKVFASISELHRELGLPKPLHPLISLVDYGLITQPKETLPQTLLLGFYKISYKKYFHGRLKYGQGHYDFDEGGLSFVAPNQVIAAGDEDGDYSGYTLLVHPDLLRNYPLARTIRNYGFFDYSVAEALYLSDKEKDTIVSVFKAIEQELQSSIDELSQELLLSLIEVLLNYSKRFYKRQFITRKTLSHDLLLRVELLLAEYFDREKKLEQGLPSVQYLAEQLKVSPRYLSDLLRTLTGQTAQQHIHNHLIEKAKEMLSGSDLSIAEVAYQLGFGHPPSFHKLFKRKTKVSPLEFRASFRS